MKAKNREARAHLCKRRFAPFACAQGSRCRALPRDPRPKNAAGLALRAAIRFGMKRALRTGVSVARWEASAWRATA
jgi:hypothetical protein